MSGPTLPNGSHAAAGSSCHETSPVTLRELRKSEASDSRTSPLSVVRKLRTPKCSVSSPESSAPVGAHSAWQGHSNTTSRGSAPSADGVPTMATATARARSAAGVTTFMGDILVRAVPATCGGGLCHGPRRSADADGILNHLPFGA